MEADFIITSQQPVEAEPVAPPRHPHQPEFPEPGIYFGMPEDVYHSIHACSASGLKRLSVSSMDYWADSPLNLERETEEESKSSFLGKALGRAYHARICEGQQEYLLRYAPALDKDDYQDLLVTVDDIRKRIDEKHGLKPKGTKKEDLINQLLEVEPTAPIWDRLVEEHKAANDGKVLIPMKYYRRIEIAWAMIMGDPQLKGAFTGGHAEVSVFWYDKATGAPMKARFDYLKMNHLVDLKSFANKMGKPVQRAIDMAISNEKYFIPVVVYLEAIAAAKEMIIATKAGCIDGPGDRRKELVEWCWKWAHQPEPEVLFVFQQTGKAPVTRGRIMPKGSTYTITDYAVQYLKRKWVRCAKTFDTDPWVDVEPVVRTEDESMTWAATDFGETT